MSVNATGSLRGRRIVVTRPLEQAGRLSELIAQRGGIAVQFPVLVIEPAADDRDLAAAVENLDACDMAFFVSPNAVKYALDYVLARRPWPSKVKLATVGKGSQRAVEAYGFSGVIAPESGFDSESVLALEAFSEPQIAGRHLIVFRGDGGRDLLGETVRRRGGTVSYVSCYRRACPANDGATLIELAGTRQLDAITLTSSEGVDNFASMLGDAGMATLRDVPVFAPHPRIVERAQFAGFTTVLLTAPGDDGLMQALDVHFNSLG